MAVALSNELVTVAETWDHVFKDVDPSSKSTDEQDALARLINGVSASIAAYVGPIRNTAFVEKYDGGGTRIFLKHSPVVSISSVTENGMTLVSGTDYLLYSAEGFILRYAGNAVTWPYWPGDRTAALASYLRWYPLPQSVEVSYTAGRAATVTVVPHDIKTAALLWIHQLWGSGPANLSNVIMETGAFIRPDGMPPQVRQILRPYEPMRFNAI